MDNITVTWQWQKSFPTAAVYLGCPSFIWSLLIVTWTETLGFLFGRYRNNKQKKSHQKESLLMQNICSALVQVCTCVLLDGSTRDVLATPSSKLGRIVVLGRLASSTTDTDWTKVRDGMFTATTQTVSAFLPVQTHWFKMAIANIFALKGHFTPKSKLRNSPFACSAVYPSTLFWCAYKHSIYENNKLLMAGNWIWEVQWSKSLRSVIL